MFDTFSRAQSSPHTGTNELDKGELQKMSARLSFRRKQLMHHMQKKNNKSWGLGSGRLLKRGRRAL
jgi:hypothetical protein